MMPTTAAPTPSPRCDAPPWWISRQTQAERREDQSAIRVTTMFVVVDQRCWRERVEALCWPELAAWVRLLFGVRIDRGGRCGLLRLTRKCAPLSTELGMLPEGPGASLRPGARSQAETGPPS